MCSLSMRIGMENYQGDLTDILRSGAAGSSTVNSISSTSLLAATEEEETRGGGVDSFGDPFSSYIRDPLLHELTTSSSSSAFFTSSTTSEMNMEASSHHAAPFGQHRHGEVTKRPLASSNIFSRTIQISPGGDVAEGMGGGGGVMVGSNDVMINNASSSRGCLIENTGVALQISSPRNPGIKRR